MPVDSRTLMISINSLIAVAALTNPLIGLAMSGLVRF
jgi:hypothetical protein